MAVPAGGNPAIILSGDVASLRGAIPVDILSGTFVKSITVPSSGPDMGKIVIVAQDAAGAEQQLVITVGTAVIAPFASYSVFLGWRDPTGFGFPNLPTMTAADFAGVPTQSVVNMVEVTSAPVAGRIPINWPDASNQNGFSWFAVPSNLTVTGFIYTRNQFGNYVQQTGTVTYQSVDYNVWVSADPQAGFLFTGAIEVEIEVG